MSEPQGKAVQSRLTRDDEHGLAHLHLVDNVESGKAVTQRAVSVSADEAAADEVLTFDREGRLLGVEFLRQRHLPPGW